MCLDRVKVNIKMERWGSWHWHNAGYGENLGFSTDGKMHHGHLATAGCGGGNKIESYDDMPADVAETDARLSQLEEDHRLICKLMFVQPQDLDESMKARTSYAKKLFINKFKKSLHQWRKSSESLWVVLGTVLDQPRISHNHPHFEYMREKSALQCAS